MCSSIFPKTTKLAITAGLSHMTSNPSLDPHTSQCFCRITGHILSSRIPLRRAVTSVSYSGTKVADNDRNELRQIGLDGFIRLCEPLTQIDSKHLYSIELAFGRPDTEDGTRRQAYMLGLHMLEIESPETFSRENTQDIHQIDYGWHNYAIPWLRECINHHELCKKSSPSVCTAARLLYVGHSQDYSDMKLETTPDDGWNNVPYAVLSHCWGDYAPLRLTTENIEQMKNKVEFQRLHRTVKHAIIAVRFLPADLRVQHIWIDSLCIIQNSEQDWNAEAPKMGSIYQNAVVSLAATFGRNGNTGLFRERINASLEPYVVRPAWDEKGRIFACEDRWPEMSMLKGSALGQRAWCFQEAMLAPRIIHFSAQQLFWECSTLTANEAYPQGTPRRFSFRKNISLDTWTMHMKGPYGRPETEPYSIWDIMVAEYSECLLTHGTDKLVAIGSLALSLQHRFEGTDTYVAGLWRSQLPQALTWKLGDAKSGPGAQKPEPWRAPSWSWASADGRVVLVRTDSTSATHAEILGLQVSYQNDNIALGVTKAELRIRGPFALVDLETIQSREETADKAKYRRFPLKLKGANFKGYEFHEEKGWVGGAFCAFDTRRGHLTTSPVYALLIWSHDGSSEGLLVQKCLERPEVWERCGQFRLYQPADLATFLEQSAITSLEGCVCEGHDIELHKHTIVLV